MRILAISLILPWPQDEGARMRAGQSVRALTEVADVDLYSVHATAQAPDPPPDLPLRRVRVRPRPVAGRVARRSWMRPGGPPQMVAGWREALRVDLHAWAEPPYDLVWVIRAAPLAAVGVPDFAPLVVDLDDLEDQKALERASISSGMASRAFRIDAAHWARWQRTLARAAIAVGVCSEADRARVGYPNAVVIPNGYEPAETVVRPDPRAPGSPRLLLQGKLIRPPLLDAAQILAGQVLPIIRQAVPDAGVDLVGENDRRVRSLSELPGVRVHGRVESMTPFLASADLVVVPMRWGSGTRIKILEAFAHRIPVVSSPIGAEGLDVESGRHLLIAEDPKDLAAACVRVLQDPALARRLTDEAYGLWESRYRWEPIRTQIGDLARSLAATGTAP